MAKQPIGLGKGLDALLGEVSAHSAGSEGALSLAISQVSPGLNQPRKHFDQEALEELADSIRIHGIIQPLTVRRLQTGYYQIIAGERRWRAAKLAGLTHVPATVIEADDRKVMELALIENLQREDLNPMEEAAGYAELLKEYGLTQELLALQMGKSRSAIGNALRLLSLPLSVQAMVEDGRLSLGHAKAVMSLVRAEQQERLAEYAVSRQLSVRETEKFAKSGFKTRSVEEEEVSPAPLEKDDPKLYIAALEEDLGKRLQRKVTIQTGKRKGKIQLEYYDSEDLETLLALLGGGSAQ
jgi:ParB-like partition proteins